MSSNIRISELDEYTNISNDDLFVLVSIKNGSKRTVKSTLNDILNFMITDTNSSLHKTIDTVNSNITSLNDKTANIDDANKSLSDDIIKIQDDIKNIIDSGTSDSSDITNKLNNMDESIKQNQTDIINIGLNVGTIDANVTSIQDSILNLVTYKNIDDYDNMSTIEVTPNDFNDTTPNSNEKKFEYKNTFESDAFIHIYFKNNLIYSSADLTYKIYLDDKCITSSKINGINYSPDESINILSLPISVGTVLKIIIITSKDDGDDILNKTLFNIICLPFKNIKPVPPNSFISALNKFDELSTGVITDISSLAINNKKSIDEINTVIQTNKSLLDELSNQYKEFTDNIETRMLSVENELRTKLYQTYEKVKNFPEYGPGTIPPVTE